MLLPINRAPMHLLMIMKALKIMTINHSLKKLDIMENAHIMEALNIYAKIHEKYVDAGLGAA